ncbi:MAG: TetR/AcrR family transcriptional regulator [Polyangiaceae bacterium]|nr:TetR/AcrR family transcriptional regulator [Polyangiaceae bacterium]
MPRPLTKPQASAWAAAQPPTDNQPTAPALSEADRVHAPRAEPAGASALGDETPPPTLRGAARERIVAAAFKVLAERGSHNTSIKEIAKAAGVAAGLVHYYFASKEALLLEVTRECSRRYRDEMASIPLPEDPREQTRTLLHWSKDRGLTLPDWYRLLVDLDALALRDAALAKEVSDLKREVRAHLCGHIAAVEGRLSRPLGQSHTAYAAVLMAAVDGLILQRLIDPEFDMNAGFSALESMLIALLEQRNDSDDKTA